VGQNFLRGGEVLAHRLDRLARLSLGLRDRADALALVARRLRLRGRQTLARLTELLRQLAVLRLRLIDPVGRVLGGPTAALVAAPRRLGELASELGDTPAQRLGLLCGLFTPARGRIRPTPRLGELGAEPLDAAGRLGRAPRHLRGLGPRRLDLGPQAG